MVVEKLALLCSEVCSMGARREEEGGGGRDMGSGGSRGPPALLTGG